MNRKQDELLRDIKDVGITKASIASKLNLTSAHFSMMLNGNATMPDEVRVKVKSIINQARRISI